MKNPIFDNFVKNPNEENRKLVIDLLHDELSTKAGRMKALSNMLTVNHTGKMSGLFSISTNNYLNHNCETYKKLDGAICGKCFADAQLSYQEGTFHKTALNTIILTETILSHDEIALVFSTKEAKEKIEEGKPFRFESFGDLNNPVQVINYLHIAEYLKQFGIDCAIWTKNPFLFDIVFKSGYTKPANLNIGVSSLYINDNMGGKLEKFNYFIDFVFTVYTADFLASHKEIKINCGARSCLKCLQCYRKINAVDGPIFVNELLKQDTKKAIKLGIQLAD